MKMIQINRFKPPENRDGDSLCNNEITLSKQKQFFQIIDTETIIFYKKTLDKNCCFYSSY